VRTEEELSRRRAAAARVVAVQWRYARRGTSLAQAALGGAREFVALRHYPRDDAIDAASGTQFYYHAHDSRRRPPEEHGHFHLFVRAPRAARGAATGFVHVAALSLDARGLPLRWFTTNRWVTGERFAPADEVIAALPRLRPSARGRLTPVAQWLGAMVELYARPVAALLRRRDAVIARRSAGAPRERVLEDRSLDVVTEHRIDLPADLARLAAT
jgi:hypothetical protein